MQIEYQDNRKHDRFKNIMLGNVFEFDRTLYLKIGFADDSGITVNAYNLYLNQKTSFKANDIVIPRNFVLKEV